MDEGQVGFTYDQYISYVEGQRNGKEPFTEYVRRMHFMNFCFQRNYGLWVKDGAYALLDILLVKFLS